MDEEPEEIMEVQYVPPDNDHALRFNILCLIVDRCDMKDVPKHIVDIEQAVKGKRPRAVS